MKGRGKRLIALTALLLGALTACGRNAPPRTLGEMSSGGGTVQLLEDGAYAPYRIVAGDRGGVWLLREEILPGLQAFNDYLAWYPDSGIDAYLSGPFLERFPEAYGAYFTPAELIVTARESLYTTDGKTQTIERTAFLLSYAEVGYPGHSMAAAEGGSLGLFPDDGSRVALRDGKPCSWWLRTPYTGFDSVAWSVGGDGVRTELSAAMLNGIRPALCLSPDTPVHARQADGKLIYTI